MVVLAGVDSRIGPQELATLEKVYKLLSLKREDISRDVHAMATALRDPAPEPVTIVPADETAPSFAVPAERPESQVSRVNLSSERVAAIIAETHQVSQVLGDVFAQSEASEPSEHDVSSSMGRVESAVEIYQLREGLLAGLDEAHSTLVRQLAVQPLWSRADVEQMSDRLGLMMAGAIEAINDAAYERVGEPFIEGDDPLEINTEIVSEFIDA